VKVTELTYTVLFLSVTFKPPQNLFVMLTKINTHATVDRP